MNEVHVLSLVTPEDVFGFPIIGGRNPGVVGAGPEPSVDDDGLEGLGLTAFAGEVALATG